jgi:hypothetical protein
MNCNLAVQDLVGRGDEICTLVRPLIGKGRVAFHRIASRQAVLFGIFSGPRLDSPIDEWRFTTFVPLIRAAYRERWIPADEKAKRYYLEQAYLHLYQQSPYGESERQFLALHCDPNEPDDKPHAMYKQGPHVHVVSAPQPIPHSHFALNLGNLPAVLASVQNLHSALATAVTMLQQQVLEVYSGRHTS